jgi:hypothetical protein
MQVANHLLKNAIGKDLSSEPRIGGLLAQYLFERQATETVGCCLLETRGSDMANVDKLLHGSSDGDDLLTKLELLPNEENLFKTAKVKIREHLKKVIGEATRDRLGRTITPRFFTQGSDKYKTLNRPAWMPPQRKDLDDGVYLPITFIKNARPSEAASTFFAIVDAALEDLIKREGWKGFEAKPTCARVLIDVTTHVDVPLYAIPDEEFGKLAKATLDSLMAADSFDFMRSRIDRLDSWDVLPSDKVLLAHREDDWKPSDPRKVHEWFLDGIETYGERLRRECRYLKAWRDHFRLNHISSIILMVCAWTVFEKVGQLHIPSRDDLMLVEIAKCLPDLFSQPIANPTDPDEMLGTKWTAEERTAAITAAAKMYDEINMAVHRCYLPEIAVKHMQTIFGARIPNRTDLVSVKTTAAATIAAAPVVYVPAPEVGRSKSG